MPITPSRDELLTCLHVGRWADAVASGSYPHLLAMERAAVAAATPLAPEEVAEAAAHLTRIGDAPVGDGHEAHFAAREQAASRASDPDLDARLEEAHALYEARFGRIFVIRALDRTRAEIVDELEARLLNDEVAELAETANQLRGIALDRLRVTYGPEFAAESE